MGAIGAHFVGGTSKLQVTITNVFGDKERLIAGEVKGDKNGIVYITIYPNEALKDIRSFYLTPTGIYTVWVPDKSSSSSRVNNHLVSRTTMSQHHETKKSVSSSQSSSVVSSSKQVNSSRVKSSSINSTSKNGVQLSSTIKGTTQGTNNNTQNDVNTTQSNNTLPETGTKSFNVFEFLIDLFK